MSQIPLSCRCCRSSQIPSLPLVFIMHLPACRYAATASLLLTSYLVDASPFLAKRNGTSPYYPIGTGSSSVVNITSSVTDASTPTTSSSQASSTISSARGGAEQSFNPSQPPLQPAVHPNRSPDQVENLAPATQQSLYYSSNAAAGDIDLSGYNGHRFNNHSQALLPSMSSLRSPSTPRIRVWSCSTRNMCSQSYPVRGGSTSRCPMPRH